MTAGSPERTLIAVRPGTPLVRGKRLTLQTRTGAAVSFCALCDEGIRVHRRTLRADEITSIHGLPVTTAARTLFDLAAMITSALDRAMAVAEHRFPTIRNDLLKLLERYPAYKGTRVLRALVMDTATPSFTCWHQLAKEPNRTLVQLALVLAKSGDSLCGPAVR